MLSAKNFRNLDLTLTFDGRVNVISGENAQGKTNIVEAIWLMSAGKSFRTSRESELISFSADSAELSLYYTSGGRQNRIDLVLRGSRPREIYLNGVRKKRMADILGSFYAVIFTPFHLSLIKDGPAERRRFVDTAMCQLKPAYLKSLGTYNRLLDQRNALLKQIREGRARAGDLAVWEERLALEGARVIAGRKGYLTRLMEKASEEHGMISGGKEELGFSYITLSGHAGRELTALEGEAPDAGIKELALYLLKRLESHRERDIREGVTTTGPHRDDIDITINGKSARLYGSQGQCRSAVLAMKAAECGIIEEETGEAPVLLLDDVLSELDVKRKRYILGRFSKSQLFITCCDERNLKSVPDRSVFRIVNGQTKK